MQETRKKRTYGGTGKKLFIILFSLGLAVGASAQRGGGHAYVGGGFHGGGFHGGGFHGGYYGRGYYAPGYGGYGLGYGLGWGLGWGYPGWYGPWYGPYAAYPPYYYGYGTMPSGLHEQINGIKSDYKQQIKDVKHDRSLPKSERDQRVNQLEQQRDAAITQARHDYFYNSMRNYNGQPQRYNGNGQPQNNSQPNNQQPNSQQPNSKNLQPGPTNGSSSSDADHPEYSDKNANGNQ
jgi:hypothetical protein